MTAISSVIQKILDNRATASIVLVITVAIYLGKKIAGNPMYWISLVAILAAVLFIWFIIYSVNKNNNYLSIAIFSLLLVSPFLTTGLAVKGHIRLNEMLLFAAIPLLFIVKTLKRERVRFGILDLWFITMVGAMVVSIFIGYAKGVSPAYVDFSYIIYLLTFWLYFRIGLLFDVNKKVITAAVLAPIVCILFFDLISFIQDTPWGLVNVAPYYMPEGTMQRTMEGRETSGFFRLAGILGDPNVLALVMVILLSLLMSWRLYIRKYDLLVKSAIFISFIVFLLTFSRNGIMIFLISQCYLLLFGMKDGVKKVFRKTVPYFTVLLLSVPFLYKFLIFQFRFNTLFTGSVDRRAAMSDLDFRLASWKDGFHRAMSISPLWGRGAMSGEPFDDSIYGSIAPHNEYISILVYGGAIGLILYLSFFGYMFWKTCQLIKNKGYDFRVVYLCRSLQAIILALAAFSIFDGFWYNNVIPPILMVLFGIMHSFDRLPERV